MSDYVDPKYTPKQMTLQMVNAYVHIHDLRCHCKQPLRHIIQQIEEQEPTIKKWRDSTTTAAGSHDGDADIDHFGPGELEKLFAEDTEENDG